MSTTARVTVAITLLVLATSPTQAQSPDRSGKSAAARSPDHGDLRRKIFVMEGALVRAVSSGAQQLNREIRMVVPEMVALAGEPQARGVYLDGYGVFFDVGVPILQQSMMWSLRTMLGQDSRGVAEALNVVKQSAKELAGARRVALENAIARLELQIGPVGDPTGSDLGLQDLPESRLARGAGRGAAGPAVTAQTIEGGNGASSSVLSLEKKYLQDPNAINHLYTELVQQALIDAMLDFGLTMTIDPNEYLTVGARDNMQRDSLAPPDPFEEVVTILLRIKGSDLADYRAARIDRAEIRKRIEVRQF